MAMSKSLYLINPTTDFVGYYTADVFGGTGFAPAVYAADLAITTIAAMAPRGFDIILCEEYLTPVDLDSSADFIGITGKITQWERMRSLATEFRRRGKPVIIGGPFASLSPDVVRPHCDILIRGEIEEIASEIFSDLASGKWKEEYVGEKPDLRLTPLPRWDLYPNDRAINGTLQTSRGCPFECEFCDAIQYVGRKQRQKPVEQVLNELDGLYRYGYRNLFVADDNFTAYRSHVRELLTAIQHWNKRQEFGKMRLSTQVSIDAGRDESLVQLCADAGIGNIFIGIETPNQESLKETKKHQNVKVDLVERVETFVENGIMVSGGMMVGFDHDGPDIFQRQYDFAMSTPIPIFSLGALVAPAATPLHERMKKAQRLTEGEEVAAAPWSTNILPQNMTRQELLGGVQWLCNKLYDPAAFGHRLLRYIDLHGKRRPNAPFDSTSPPAPRSISKDILILASRLQSLGPKERELWHVISARIAKKPQAGPMALGALMQYMQIRYMYDRGHFWEPMLTQESKPRSEVIQPIKIAQLADLKLGAASLPSKPSSDRQPAVPSASDGGTEPERLLAALGERNIKLHLEGEELVIRAPKGMMTDALRHDIAANKASLVTALKARSRSAVAHAGA
jgi:hypothetical protein